jgi:hypothetical protein
LLFCRAVIHFIGNKDGRDGCPSEQIVFRIFARQVQLIAPIQHGVTANIE